MQTQFFILILAISIAFNKQCVVHGIVCLGCIELDELTFDKITSKFSVVLVKFDIAFPFGKKHDEYSKFALEVADRGEYTNDFAVSVVGIKNYGDKTNSDLIDRFSIGDQLPIIKLFSGLNEWVDFPNGAYLVSILCANDKK